MKPHPTRRFRKETQFLSPPQGHQKPGFYHKYCPNTQLQERNPVSPALSFGGLFSLQVKPSQTCGGRFSKKIKR
jgi:hypothetical protein